MKAKNTYTTNYTEEQNNNFGKKIISEKLIRIKKERKSN